MELPRQSAAKGDSRCRLTSRLSGVGYARRGMPKSSSRSTTTRSPNVRLPGIVDNGPNRRRCVRVITRLSWLWLLARAFVRVLGIRKRNRRRVVLSAVLLAVVVLTTSLASTPTDPAIVNTEGGAVRGVVTGEYRTFSGIPFAAPPVGWQFVRHRRCGATVWEGTGGTAGLRLSA